MVIYRPNVLYRYFREVIRMSENHLDGEKGAGDETRACALYSNSRFPSADVFAMDMMIFRI